MSLSWRDGATTLAAAAAIIIERAHFHDWSWPLVHEVGWAVVAVALLGFAIFQLSYVMDEDRGTAWSVTAYISSLAAAALAIVGVITANADFLVLTMLVVVFFWLASVVRHAWLPATHDRGLYAR